MDARRIKIKIFSELCGTFYKVVAPHQDVSEKKMNSEHRK